MGSATKSVIENIEKVLVGKRKEIELAMIAMLAPGHLLIEDVPGVGKTVLSRSLARSLDVSFKRIQCTPDLLPTDVTGVSIPAGQNGEFEFRPGPVFAEVVLVDEINRATPKTQSALLEAMEERQVTVDGVTHPLPRLFIVLATQNPIEYEGTFPLPEAQRDRFLMRLRIGYPEREEDEIEMLDRQSRGHPLQDLAPVATVQGMLNEIALVQQVYEDPLIESYVVQIVRATRIHLDVLVGASPRGSLALRRAAQARAYLEQKDFVHPEHVQELVVPTLAHRLILKPSARVKGVTAEKVLEHILAEVPKPPRNRIVPKALAE